MFEIKTLDPLFITKIFETINTIISETEVNFTPDGIQLVSIDAGRVCMVSLKIEPELFDNYKCNEKSIMGLNLEDLTKILNRCSKQDRLTLKHTEGSNKIAILMENSNGNKIRSFSLTMKDISMPPIKPESLDAIQYDNHVHIPMAYLKEIVKDAEIYGEMVDMRIDKDGLITLSESNVGEIETIINHDDPNITSISNTESANGVFALKFLKSMEKMGSIPSVDTIELYIKDDQPLKGVVRLGSDSYVKIFLAPRIEDEDEY